MLPPGDIASIAERAHGDAGNAYPEPAAAWRTTGAPSAPLRPKLALDSAAALASGILHGPRTMAVLSPPPSDSATRSLPAQDATLK